MHMAFVRFSAIKTSCFIRGCLSRFDALVESGVLQSLGNAVGFFIPGHLLPQIVNMRGL